MILKYLDDPTHYSPYLQASFFPSEPQSHVLGSCKCICEIIDLFPCISYDEPELTKSAIIFRFISTFKPEPSPYLPASIVPFKSQSGAL